MRSLRRSNDDNPRYTTQKNAATGKIYAVSGGRANQALVALSAQARWYTEDGGTWVMAPQCLYPARTWFAADGFDALIDWISSDINATMIGRKSKLMAPTVIIVDVSQSPDAVDLLRELESDFIRVVPVRLGAGDDSPLKGYDRTKAGSLRVGANWLVSWFNNTISRDEPEEQLHGHPLERRKIVMGFQNYVDEVAPGMTMAELREAMASAESLIKKATTASGEEVLDLSAPETVACAVMLAALALQINPPSVSFDIRSPWGWGPRQKGNFFPASWC